ncbi:hypothetical protein BSNK01_11930 [Bacillaceae bacterium]
MISENWGELLLPGLRTIFDKHMKKLRDYLPVIFNVETSNKAQEFNLGVGSMGLMEEWTKSGNQVAYEEVNKGFKATYTHRKYSKGLQIERELLEDDLYSEIKKRTRNLAQSVYYTRQFYAASVFNNAFNPNYVGPDGKPLCATDHPLAPGATETWSNFDQLELNADNVELVRNRMMAWTDDKGNLLAINPDTLIVPPSLRKAALVIADSDKEPDTANNNVNIWKGSLDVIEWPFLTDPNAWFMVDSQRMKNFLNWYDRRKAQLESDDEFDTEVAKYKVVARFSFGWDDASFIYGCNPS